MFHNCQALVIHCIDFRFHTAIRDFLLDQGLKDQYDLVSTAGVTKGLVDADISSKEIILKQIEISQSLHGISEVYIIHHLDCGAYGGHSAFSSLEEEQAKQIADLEKAESIIQAKFPDLVIKKILAKIEEQGGKREIEFEIVN